MLKALLIVTSLAGGHEHSVEMPTMVECLQARTLIAEQDSDVKTLCIPVADESQKMEEFFYLFLDMMEKLKQEESNDEWRKPEECLHGDRCIYN